MTREVSRRLSYDPVLKGAIRPDRVGERQLDPKHVEDRVDPVTYLDDWPKERVEAEAKKTDDYLKTLGPPTDGAARTTGYKDNVNE